ncbi:D-threo-aldose 1-dehydrogenase [Geomicrobium halophilum]|uniref:D-threo-aldose 1-dehydrogenase n=1 Tax=Geomicrobium halophilum TaxID=549000 RepID=A0A841Q043_9BACL|nr:aldo/keto reductase [Geomicrobium halophilum]MBB6450853.1 D-threo-aldose 1-dehydrogenase [Geomicrobium halophilum]
MDEASLGKIGLGTAPLGNMYRDIPEKEVKATIDAAWDHGIRYFDTAPFYGAGLSEIRVGNALSQYNRDDFMLSTKVGRVISDEWEEKNGLFEFGRKNKVITDYSEDATLRSIEQSLERLKTDRLDFVYAHDISPDFHGDEWISKFDTARKGAFRVLTRLREEGVIKSWGIGVNTTEPIELALELEESKPDLCLQATHYTLLNHERALQRLMPAAQEKGVGIVVGAPYNSGVLVGGSHYNYQEAPSEITSKVAQIKEIAQRHQVSLKAAALQFSTAHPAVASVIPGSSRPERINEDITAIKAEIPSAFWQEMREQELVSPMAPLPIHE